MSWYDRRNKYCRFRNTNLAWDPGVDAKSQGRYSRNTECVFYEALGKYNDWSIILLQKSKDTHCTNYKQVVEKVVNTVQSQVVMYGETHIARTTSELSAWRYMQYERAPFCMAKHALHEVQASCRQGGIHSTITSSDVWWNTHCTNYKQDVGMAVYAVRAGAYRDCRCMSIWTKKIASSKYNNRINLFNSYKHPPEYKYIEIHSCAERVKGSALGPTVRKIAL